MADRPFVPYEDVVMEFELLIPSVGDKRQQQKWKDTNITERTKWRLRPGYWLREDYVRGIKLLKESGAMVQSELGLMIGGAK